MVAVWGSQAAPAFLANTLGTAPSPGLGAGGVGNSNRIYLPFLARSYTVGPSILGIQMADFNNDTKVSRVIEAGAKWVRVAVLWDKVEPENTTPANFTWSEYDAMFGKAAQLGLTPIVTVTGNPSWAADTSCGPINRTSLQEMAQFLAALVSRYGRSPYQVKYWELYNEPDNGNSVRYYWLGGCWGNNGREYGQMLQSVYPAVKAADPEAQVVLGSLAYDWFTDQNGPFVRSFLDEVLDPQKGSGGLYFDILGFHYYYVFADLWEPYGKDLMGKATFLRSKLASYGLSKPLVLTEVGLPSGVSGEFQGSNDLQSSYVVQAFVRSMAADLKMVIWYSLADYDAQKLGLLDSSLSPKPSYMAYRALSSQLEGAIYRRPVDPTSYPGVEGYIFSVPASARETWVLWASGNSQVTVAIPANQALLADKLGQASTRSDGDDGAWDGKVSVPVTSSPIYLQVLS